MDGKPQSIWIGYDPREAEAFMVARTSIEVQLTMPIPIYGLYLGHLRRRRLYTRPTSVKDGRLWDDISEAPMSTEFAISRFLVPKMARGWALFVDGDVVALESLARLFELADDRYAVQVVKHRHEPMPGVKMGGQLQTRYARKNWSSVMLFNCDHPAHKRLTKKMINTVPGRELHAFTWLRDHEIGELPKRWNYLVGHSKSKDSPALIHFTEGVPTVPGYERSKFAREYFYWLQRWVRGNVNAIGATI